MVKKERNEVVVPEIPELEEEPGFLKVTDTSKARPGAALAKAKKAVANSRSFDPGVDKKVDMVRSGDKPRKRMPNALHIDRSRLPTDESGKPLVPSWQTEDRISIMEGFDYHVASPDEIGQKVQPYNAGGTNSGCVRRGDLYLMLATEEKQQEVQHMEDYKWEDDVADMLAAEEAGPHKRARDSASEIFGTGYNPDAFSARLRKTKVNIAEEEGV